MPWRIVTTYHERTTQDKYSYVAPLTKSADNDYNLNFHRYVDTFEPESLMDLAAASAELKAIGQALDANAEVLEGFSRELGIEPPSLGARGGRCLRIPYTLSVVCYQHRLSVFLFIFPPCRVRTVRRSYAFLGLGRRI